MIFVAIQLHILKREPAILENLPFWPHLTGDQQQYLVRSAGFREYRQGQQLYDSR